FSAPLATGPAGWAGQTPGTRGEGGEECEAMPKFMSSHKMPAGALGREEEDQLALAAMHDPVGRPDRGVLNTAGGKIYCVMEAPSAEALAAWFLKMQMPCDGITPVELEGDRGVVKEA